MAKARNRSQGQNQGNQQAPGRDMRQQSYGDQPGQADVNAAIGGGIPAGNAAFAGAKQTIGAQDSQPGDPAYTPPQQAPQPAPAPMNPAGNQPHNTGITGGMANPMAPAQPAAQSPFAVPGQAGAGTKLWGTLDQAKLASPEHAAKSPKYQLLQAAQGMDSYDIPKLLQTLQGQDANRWNGWQQVSADKLRFMGDRSKLDPRFNGATELDLIADVDNPQGWTFQTNLPDAPARGGIGQSPMMGAILGNLSGGASNAPDFSTTLRDQIMQALTNPQLADRKF